MKNKKKMQIVKWNVYNANVNFLEIEGSKIRPVIAVATNGIAVFIIPLTTNLKQRTKYDIDIKINNTKGLIKVGNLQRIYENDLISPYYSFRDKKITKISKDMQNNIKDKLVELLIDNKDKQGEK